MTDETRHRLEALLQDVRQAILETGNAPVEWNMGGAGPRYEAIVRWHGVFREVDDVLAALSTVPPPDDANVIATLRAEDVTIGALYRLQRRPDGSMEFVEQRPAVSPEAPQP